MNDKKIILSKSVQERMIEFFLRTSIPKMIQI